MLELWIARDMDGELFLFMDEPELGPSGEVFICIGGDAYRPIEGFPDLAPGQKRNVRLLIAPEPASAPVPTVRVRIAVAVDEHGNWNAAGWNGEGMEIVAVNGLGMADSHRAIYYVEADVPLPVSQTIPGAVVPAPATGSDEGDPD